MKNSPPSALPLCLCCASLLAPPPASALIMVGQGRPLSETRLAWWRAIPRQFEIRVGWSEGPPFGGGQSQFRSIAVTPPLFSQALTAFAAIRTPALDLVLHDGPHTNGFLRVKKAG